MICFGMGWGDFRRKLPVTVKCWIGQGLSPSFTCSIATKLGQSALETSIPSADSARFDP